MEHKIYLLVQSVKYESDEIIRAYSQEHTAAAECVRLNNLPKPADVVFFVQELEVIDFDGA